MSEDPKIDGVNLRPYPGRKSDKNFNWRQAMKQWDERVCSHKIWRHFYFHEVLMMQGSGGDERGEEITARLNVVWVTSEACRVRPDLLGRENKKSELVREYWLICKRWDAYFFSFFFSFFLENETGLVLADLRRLAPRSELILGAESDHLVCWFKCIHLLIHAHVGPILHVCDDTVLCTRTSVMHSVHHHDVFLGMHIHA